MSVLATALNPSENSSYKYFSSICKFLTTKDALRLILESFSTGFVTTTRVSHATPAALYAHSADRRWECDADMDEATARGCKDIARQLVEDAPGADLKVIFGGGRGHMGAPLPTDADNGTCARADGQNLVEKWLSEKRKTGKSVKYVTNAKELREMRPESTDYIMGKREKNGSV